MKKSIKFPENDKSSPMNGWKRWFYAITGHFMFLVFMGCVHCVGLIPTIWFAYLFLKTGNLLFVVVLGILAGIPGVIWTAIHRMTWSLQFGFPIYLFKELWIYIKQSFRQGWQLGMIFAFLWSIVLAPVYVAERYQQPLPFGIVCLIAILALLLFVITPYTYYQISRYVFSVRVALRNSVLLLFNMGWRSVLVCLLWIVFVCGMLLAAYIVIPACMFCGLTVILCATEQAIFVPHIDELLKSR